MNLAKKAFVVFPIATKTREASCQKEDGQGEENMVTLSRNDKTRILNSCFMRGDFFITYSGMCTETKK